MCRALLERRIILVRDFEEYERLNDVSVERPNAKRYGSKSAIIAPPEIVAKYGLPPGGGKISPRQGVPYMTADPARPGATDPRVGGSAAPAPPPPIAQVPLAAPSAQPQPAASAAVKQPVPVAAPEPPKRGYVVLVEPSRIVVDLTAVDGVRPGSLLSLRRDRIPLVHPVTGEVLGELDDEVGTARVTETREKFSLAEVQSTAPGAEVQVRDRVVPK